MTWMLRLSLDTRCPDVGIPDRALPPFVHHRWEIHARIVAWAVENGLGDKVAWAEIVEEAKRRKS